MIDGERLKRIANEINEAEDASPAETPEEGEAHVVASLKAAGLDPDGVADLAGYLAEAMVPDMMRQCKRDGFTVMSAGMVCFSSAMVLGVEVGVRAVNEFNAEQQAHGAG